MLTFLEDFKKNPKTANPYLVITCFDELVRAKQIALLRGDVISHMTQDEGATVMDQLLDSYLIDSEYEKVRQFNHSPAYFDFEKHTRDSMISFKTKLKKVKAERTEDAHLFLGPQKHSKPHRPMLPGQGNRFFLDEI